MEAQQPAGLSETVHPLVRRLLAPNPSAFTYTGTQTYIVGHGRVVVVDPGPDLPEHVDALAAVLADEQVIAIVCTHTHRDHSPASRPLKAITGAPIVGCAPLALTDDGPRADAAFDTDYAADRVLADGERIEGDGWSLMAVATPGHTSNHLCYALAEAGALFTGDHVMGWSTTVVSPPDGDMADYMASLDKLAARDDAVYYPAHGPAVERPQRFVRGLAGHRRQREGQILRLLQGGERRIPAMVATMYAGVDPGLHPAAGKSVLAHLIALEGARPRGARRRGLGPRGVIRPVAKAGLAAALVLALLIGAALWGVREVRRAWSPDPETIATASLEGLREQSRLSALVARYVAVVTARQSRFGLTAQRTLILPGTVRYEVDLAKLKPGDVTWRAGTRTLEVVLPPVELAGPEVDLAALREYDGGGLLLRLTDAGPRLDEANRRAGAAELLRQAREPVPMRLARDATRRAIERSFALPLRAAGLDATVRVRFADEPGFPADDGARIEQSRSLEDVYGRTR